MENPSNAVDSKYGEMYIVDNSTDTVIVETNVWQPVAGLFQVGDLKGWTFTAGETNSITAFADAGGGEVTVTAAGHSFSAGEYITITGTTNYNGRYEVESVSGNDFNITATWSVDDATGTAIRGDAICPTIGGEEYRISYGASMTSGNSKIFEFALSKNTLMCEKCRVQRKFGTAGDYGDAGRSSLVGNGVGVDDGDCFYFMVKNLTDATDLTIKHANFTMTTT